MMGESYMMSEKTKMLYGQLYNPCDSQLSEERKKARQMIQKLNSIGTDQVTEMLLILKDLIPDAGDDLWIQPPFYCDYGYNIKSGEKVYFNFNCTVLDCGPVTIGRRTLFGPNVQIYTATHPLEYQIRASGLEYAKPVTIGEDVWVGGGAIICPGVTIGDRSVIGAGSVVTKNIPSDVLAAGNPCKVIRVLQYET